MERNPNIGSWSPGNLCVIEWTKLPEPPFFAADYRKVAEVYDQADVPKLAAAKEMYEALAEAVEKYGKPGGPWNVPGEPGSWIAKARAALKKARGQE